jgi:hypothetical protein
VVFAIFKHIIVGEFNDRESAPIFKPPPQITIANKIKTIATIRQKNYIVPQTENLQHRLKPLIRREIAA